MFIAKFGGTSVSAAERINTICNIARRGINKKPIIVVSALSEITDLLLSLPKSSKSELKETIKKIKDIHFFLIKDFFKEEKLQEEINQFIDSKIKEIEKVLARKKLDKCCLDLLVSFGEIMSSYIITRALNYKKIKATQILGTDLIKTNNSFSSAEVLWKQSKKQCQKVLIPLIKKNIVPVVTGFIGSTEDGKTTTLGRGGSDYSASIIGFCLNASEIQIWTDVNGILTCDPRIVEKAKLIPQISFREASELAAFGAKVLHPRTIKPAIKANIPVKVLNTFNPKNKGTSILNKANFSNPINAIAFKRKIILVNMFSIEMVLTKGFLARIFDVFVKNDIIVDLVSVSEASVSVSLDKEEGLDSALKELSAFTTVAKENNLGMISLIGEKIISSSQTLYKIFDILNRENISVRMISLGATDINISLVVSSEKVEKGVQVLHDKLLLKQRKQL